MRWCRGVAAALLVSVPLLPELHAGPIAEYLEDAGLGKHGAAFEAVALRLRDAFRPFETPDGALRIPGRVHVVSARAAG